MKTLLIIFLTILSASAVGNQSFTERKYCFQDVEYRPLCLGSREIISELRSHKTLSRLLHRIDLQEVILATQITGIDPMLIVSVAYRESAFRKSAVSSVGAQGVMQIMPATRDYLVERYGSNVSDYVLGAIYLKHIKDLYGFNWIETVAAYNEGPTRIRTRRRSPAFATNHQYLNRVFQTYIELTNKRDMVGPLYTNR